MTIQAHPVFVFDTTVLQHAAEAFVNPDPDQAHETLCLSALRQVPGRAKLGFTQGSLEEFVERIARRVRKSPDAEGRYNQFLERMVAPHVRLLESDGSPRTFGRTATLSHQAAHHDTVVGYVTMTDPDKLKDEAVRRIAVHPAKLFSFHSGVPLHVNNVVHDFTALATSPAGDPSQQSISAVPRAVVVSAGVLIEAETAFACLASRHDTGGQSLLAVKRLEEDDYRFCFTPATWDAYDQKRAAAIGARQSSSTEMSGRQHFFEKLKSHKFIVAGGIAGISCHAAEDQLDLQAVAGSGATLLVTHSRDIRSQAQTLARKGITCVSAPEFLKRTADASRPARHNHSKPANPACSR